MSAKHLYILILLCYSLSLTLFAQTDISSGSINDLIQQIKEAPSDQKRVKINELKILLRTMNQETRKEAMNRLKRSFAKYTPNTSTQSSKGDNGLQQQYQHDNMQISQPIGQEGGRQGMGQGQGGGRR